MRKNLSELSECEHSSFKGTRECILLDWKSEEKWGRYFGFLCRDLSSAKTFIYCAKYSEWGNVLESSGCDMDEWGLCGFDEILKELISRKTVLLWKDMNLSGLGTGSTVDSFRAWHKRKCQGYIDWQWNPNEEERRLDGCLLQILNEELGDDF